MLRRRLSRLGILLRVALAAVAARTLALAVYLAASSASSVLDYTGTIPIAQGQARTDRLLEIEIDLLERLAPFDGQFYRDVARNGYRRYEQWPWGNYAFLPLYPAVLYALGGGGHWSVLAAVVLQILLSGATAVVLWTLAARLRIRPWAVVALFLAWPTSVFQVVAYPEGIFLLLSLLATLLRLQGFQWPAALAGFLAGLTRPQGVFLALVFITFGSPVRSERAGRVPPKLSGAIRSSGPSRADAVCGTDRVRVVLRGVARLVGGLRPSCLLSLSPIAGYAVYLLLVHLAVGSAGAALQIQGAWGRGVAPAGIVEALARITRFEGFPPDIAAAMFGLFMLPLLFQLLPLPLALYATASVILPLATGTPLSMGRFLSVAFPFFLALGALLGRKPRTLGALVVAGTAAQLWFLRRLADWDFVG